MLDHPPDNAGKSWWTTRAGIACMFFLAAAGYFLVTEHRAHIVPYLPYLIILACPLMHLRHPQYPAFIFKYLSWASVTPRFIPRLLAWESAKTTGGAA